MFKSYQIFENVLQQPDRVVQLANELEYFQKEEYNIEGVKLGKSSGTPNGYWRGLRSNQLNDSAPELFNLIFSDVLSNFKFKGVDVEFDIESYIHLIPESVVQDPTWFHADQSLVAGILYLNDENIPNTGTDLYIDNELVKIENVYNRLVVYNAMLDHAPSGGFGNSISNIRKAVTFFINGMKIID